MKNDTKGIYLRRLACYGSEIGHEPELSRRRHFRCKSQSFESLWTKTSQNICIYIYICSKAKGTQILDDFFFPFFLIEEENE